MTSLQGQTKGLILTGGEPTLSPVFPKVLQLARKHDFLDIAVVSNGSLLHREEVKNALVSCASSIRISMYDWETDQTGGINTILKRIETLRKKTDIEKSSLQIGVAALTSKKRLSVLFELAESIRNSGAHWIYFHPMCTGWDSGHLSQINQDGVLDEVEYYKKRTSIEDGFKVFISQDRYKDTALTFNGYHAANFLLVIGADGFNYLAPEVKYQSQYIIGNVAGNWNSEFLWQSDRAQKIKSVNSDGYPALSSRHRGVLYNDFIERIRSKKLSDNEKYILQSLNNFGFPHVL
jgi:MoaA/NifB/PqqE/SkfB family radical SAM enzyme